MYTFPSGHNTALLQPLENVFYTMCQKTFHLWIAVNFYKNSQNQLTNIKITASQRWDVFWAQCVISNITEKHNNNFVSFSAKFYRALYKKHRDLCFRSSNELHQY